MQIIRCNNPYNFRCVPPENIAPFISVVVNGTVTHTCNLGETLTLFAEGPAVHLLLSTANSSDVTVEVHFGTAAKTVCLASRGKSKCIRKSIRGRTEITVVPQRPQKLVSADEEIVKQQLLQALEDDAVNPRNGAVPSETLKAIVRRVDEERFLTVMEECGSWEQFLAKHKSSFTTFQYSESELRSRKLLNRVSPDELRVVKNYNPKVKSIPKHVKSEVLSAGVEQLRSFITQQQGVCAFDLLRVCDSAEAKSKTIGRQMCASFSILMRFLQKHKTTFRWTTDPTKRTTVGII